MAVGVSGHRNCVASELLHVCCASPWSSSGCPHFCLCVCGVRQLDGRHSDNWFEPGLQRPHSRNSLRSDRCHRRVGWSRKTRSVHSAAFNHDPPAGAASACVRQQTKASRCSAHCCLLCCVAQLSFGPTWTTACTSGEVRPALDCASPRSPTRQQLVDWLTCSFGCLCLACVVPIQAHL